MTTLKEVLDGVAVLIDAGFDPDSSIRFDHDIAYAGDTEDPPPENLVAAMERAGWMHDELEGCFILE